MMLLYRFNILDDIHKLWMVVVLVYGNWRIIDGLRWTIGTKASFIHTTYIAHVIVAVHYIIIPFQFWITAYYIHRRGIRPVHMTRKAIAFNVSKV